MNSFYRYVFSTEGHLLPATPQISLVREHCSYLGAFCKSSVDPESGKTNNATDVEEANVSTFSEGTSSIEISSSSDFSELTSTTVLIRVIGSTSLSLIYTALLIHSYHSLFSHLGIIGLDYYKGDIFASTVGSMYHERILRVVRGVCWLYVPDDGRELIK